MRHEKKSRSPFRLWLIGAASCQILAFSLASAAAENDPAQLEEVVVSAQKRSESLQTVPISAAVVSGSTISENAITSLQDLSAASLPAITLAKGSTTDRMFIRGVGSGDNPSFEQSVGTFVDDVYNGRARSSEANIFDLERVEVLKGPQSTYFGNNAIAGALNVITHDPEKSFGGEIGALYNPTFGDYETDGVLNVPITDQLRTRLAVQATGGDGWIDDLGTGQHVPSTDNKSVRLTTVWTPVDELTIRLKAQYSEETEKGGLPLVRGDCPAPAPFTFTGFCKTAVAAGIGPASSWDSRATSPGQSTDLRTQDYVATVNYDIGSQTLTSVTAYDRYSYGLQSSLSMTPTPTPLLAISAPENYQQFSQELRLASNSWHQFETMAGLYYQYSDLAVTNDFTYAFLTPTIAAAAPFKTLVPYLPLGVHVGFKQQAFVASAFGAATWHITDDLKLTAGLRDSAVVKDFAQTVSLGSGTGQAYGDFAPFPATIAPLATAFAGAAALGTPGYIPLSRTDRHLSPSANLEYQVMPSVMAYFSYANGFKAGGFNGVSTVSAGGLGFAPETVNSYEIGAKTKLANDRIILNADFFRSDYSNLQLAGILPSTSGAYLNVVRNAGQSVSQGFEFDGQWAIGDGWRTKLSGTVLDAHYVTYPNAPPTALQSIRGIAVQNLADQPTPFAPTLSGAWSLTYATTVLGGLDLIATGSAVLSEKYYLGFSDDPYLVQPGYVRADLTVSLGDSERGWEVSVIAKNLADSTIRTFGAALPTSVGSYVFSTEPPRNVGLRISQRF